MAVLTRARSWLGLAAAAVCVAGPTLAAQQPANSAESTIKAVFLFNFSKYVTWSATEVGDRSPSEIRICVTAEDAFFSLLKSAVQGEDVDGKPLVPVALDGLDAAASCQILYVGAADSADGKAWLNAVRGRQVLTVADGSLNDDTVIAFIHEGNRIRFDINRAAAQTRGLHISSKLLRLARQVRDR